mgnify:CR=1 FL=1
MRGLAKKKNNDFPLEAEEYTLPELPQTITPAGVAVQKPSQIAVAESEQRATAEPQASKEVMPQPISGNTDGATSAATPSVVPVAESSAMRKEEAQESVPQPNVVTKEEPKPQTTPAVRRSRVVGGLSLSSLMNEEVESSAVEPQATPKSDVGIDAASEEKILSCREKVVAAILEERPRFVVAFEKMKVAGHTITVEVPSQTLYEEIMRSKTEILLQIVRTAGINGSLEMEIKVNEQIRAARPIKLEDRIKYMIERNPQLATLKSLLDMEYE